MEALDEVMDSPKDHTHIIKGKRTKRQRPQSPIPLSIAAHTSSGDGGGGYGSNGDNFNATATANNTTSSPATSVEFVESVTEEEEDMANCLILLAQGHSRHQSWKPNNHDDHEDVGLKFTSKRFLEAPATGNGKEGKYFYQCKTCDRSFPSFQALGGHRASHKKAKPAVAEEKRPMMMMLLSDDEEEQYKNRVSSSSYYFSLQLSNNSKSSFKVHECSICGAEFMSGQALGGHMRRHRAPILSSSPSGFDSQDQEAKRPRKVLSLGLDLNLPAPEDDHHRESKFAFASKQQKQQSSLVLSTAPTLVDCHY